MEEILEWVRFMGMSEARDIVDEALRHEDDSRERSARIAFELTDGSNSTYDIAERIDFSREWVRTRQGEWANRGLVRKPQGARRYQHIASLTELGLRCPEIPEPEAGAADGEDEEESAELDAGEDGEAAEQASLVDAGEE
jgi:hypothetical protein